MPARVSGTAAVVVVVHGNVLWVANAGDSRAVIAWRGENATDVKHKDLTEDQKPDLPREVRREARCAAHCCSPEGRAARVCGGSVRLTAARARVAHVHLARRQEERILKAGGYVSHASPQYGPPRVWVRQGEGPGLAMSRSIGDHVCKHVGVIAKPEVFKYDLATFGKGEARICLASDGVWELCAAVHRHPRACARGASSACRTRDARLDAHTDAWSRVVCARAQPRESPGDGDRDAPPRRLRGVRRAHR